MVSETNATESTSLATCRDNSRLIVKVTHLSSHETFRQNVEKPTNDIHLSHETSRHDLKTDKIYLSEVAVVT